MTNTKVAIVIPTKNSAPFLKNCLQSIAIQTYRNREVIIVDGKSTDGTLELAKKYKCKIYTYIPNVTYGAFDASYKRNYGAAKATGNYIYWVDADMRLQPNLLKEAVKLSQTFDAIIIPEESVGVGIWARAKNLERRCYWNDDTVESPRFFKKSTWDDIGGLDESLGAGGDDLDLHQKTLEHGYKVTRTKTMVIHNEGNLSLSKLFIKRFRYGRDILKYFYKRPKKSIISFFPIHMAYLRNWRLFVNRPIDTCAFVIMRTTEYLAGFLGILYSYIEKLSLRSNSSMGIEEYADKLPQYYDETMPKTLKKYLDSSKFTSLLDCGCGDGSLLFSLKQNNYFTGKRIYAIDLSKSRISLIKKIDPRIRAYVDNAELLNTIKRNSIDFFISSFVIEHIDDKKLLHEAARVMRKHGIAYISTVFKKWYGWYFYRRNGKWVMDMTHLREYTRDEELLSLIDTNTFTLIESIKTQLYFPIIDFILRRFDIKNRKLFVENTLLKMLRDVRIPIPGYYSWEIIFRKIK